MLRECPYSIEELLIHRPPMLLLDKVVGYNEAEVVASVIITESSLLLTPEGVPGHVAIEYMAQACGAYAGAMALDAGAPVKIGLPARHPHVQGVGALVSYWRSIASFGFDRLS